MEFTRILVQPLPDGHGSERGCLPSPDREGAVSRVAERTWSYLR